MQEDASRVDAERCHQSVPEADQSLLVEGSPMAIARLHWCSSPIFSSAAMLSDQGAARRITSIIQEECVMGMSELWDLCDESVTKV